MLSILATAVVMLAVLAALQLVLVLGVIRRLREHTQLLARVRSGAPAGPPVLGAGEPIGAFASSTIDGQTIDQSSLPQPALFAFFSSECSACRGGAAELARYAADMPGGRDHVIAVIGDGAAAADLIDTVRSVARVIVEPEGGPVEAAFGVSGFPAYALVADGRTVLASGFELHSLPLPRPARPEPAVAQLALAPGGRA